MGDSERRPYGTRAFLFHSTRHCRAGLSHSAATPLRSRAVLLAGKSPRVSSHTHL